LIVAGEGATAQTNTFPSSGNAGIGTPTPSVKLEVISSVTTGTATARFKNTGANTQVVLDADASQNTNLRFDANAAPAWYFGNDASNSRFRLLNSNANGNVEVFSILQGGNVGIGTSNPAKKLHVFGTNSQVLIDRTANTAGNYALVNFATAGVQKFFFGLNADAGAGVDKLSVFDSVFSASTPVMTFTGGNVGLGTTSPLQKLQIGTNTTTATATPDSISLGATYSNTAAVNAKLRLFDDNIGNVYGLGVSLGQFDFIVPSSGRYVWSVGGSEKMRLDNNGTVGIGTSTPNSIFYDDHVLAQAAQLLTGASGYPDLHPRTRDEQVEATAAWGNYYDKQLREYCAPPEYFK
jgi:hypothetical protein